MTLPTTRKSLHRRASSAMFGTVLKETIGTGRQADPPYVSLMRFSGPPSVVKPQGLVPLGLYRFMGCSSFPIEARMIPDAVARSNTLAVPGLIRLAELGVGGDQGGRIARIGFCDSVHYRRCGGNDPRLGDMPMARDCASLFVYPRHLGCPRSSCPAVTMR